MVDPNPDGRPVTRHRSPARRSRGALLFPLITLGALLGLLLSSPSVAWAAEGDALAGPSWAWIAVMLLQALVTMVGGIAVVLVREALRSQRDSMDRLVAQVEDTRLHYVSHQQLNQRLEDVLAPMRKDLDDLEAEVRELGVNMNQVLAQNDKILALLDPRGTR